MPMPVPVSTIIAVVVSGALVIGWMRWKRAVRADYIRRYALPKGLYDKLRIKRPELALKDCQLVGYAL